MSALPTVSPVALVMAGGRGERLNSGGVAAPKPLARVGGASLLELAIGRARRAGIGDVRVALGHRATEIRRALVANGEVTFQVERAPRGTIGAVADTEGVRGDLLVQNADVLTTLELDRLMADHRASGADLTIATHEDGVQLVFGEVVGDGTGRVLEYVEKPRKSWRLSSGVYVLGPGARALVRRGEPLGFDRLVRRALEGDLEVREFRHDALWIDVNDPFDLRRARELVARDPAAFGAPPAER